MHVGLGVIMSELTSCQAYAKESVFILNKTQIH